jgi:hypothetical protein
MAFELPAIDPTTLRLRTECSCATQLAEKQEVGSPGRIRTYSLSVNSREDRKSKCPIWCRLREIGSHFSSLSCTHSCTHVSVKYLINSPSIRNRMIDSQHSAANYTAEHHKPLFWRRLATKLSPLVVPQVCLMFLAYRWAALAIP